MKKFLAFLLILFLFFSVVFLNNNDAEYVFCKAKIKTKKVNENVFKIEYDCDPYNIFKLLNVEIHSKKYIADRVIFEGYSDMFSCYEIIDGFKTNFQLSMSKDAMLVGVPLINFSF